MRTCVVPFCGNSTKKPVENLQFFKITPSRYASWMRALRRDPNDRVYKDAAVCSKHFVEEDFIVVNGRKTLKENAAPSIHLRPLTRNQLFSGPSATVKICHEDENSFWFPAIDIIDNVSTLPSSSECSREPKYLLPFDSTREVMTESDSSKSSDNSVASINFYRKRKRKITSTDSEELKGTPKKQQKIIREFHSYSKSPRTLDRSLTESKKSKTVIQSTLKKEKAKVKRLKRKISSLADIVIELEKLRLISGDARRVLEKCYAGIPSAIMKRMLQDNEKNKQGYSPEMRKFAMTLQFYSSKAYDYVCKTFNMALPCSRIIRNWLTNVNSMPGFTQQAFIALENKVKENKEKHMKTICSLMLDEMPIKQQIELQGNKIWGYIDFGTEVDDDQLDPATEALVLMVVAANDHWKIPIAYFLIKSLTAQEKANIVKQALIKLHDVGVTITSLTCDGPSAHFSMVKELGAKIDNVEEIEPYFSHPVDNSHIFIIIDACHMLKLLGHVWAVIKIFFTTDGPVDYKYIEKLYELQEAEGFLFGTKLKKKHIEWMKHKRKVNVVGQVLSKSVANALEFLMEDVKHPFFKDAGPTIKFIRLIDYTFDLLNSRSPFGRGCESPLRKSNEAYWQPIFHQACQFFKSCETSTGTLLITTQKKTPFLGFLITIQSILGIYNKFIIQDAAMDYLLTYKYSQDHLEQFFYGVRSRNGGNNNPTAYQFCQTYKRMLIYNDIKNNNGINLLDVSTAEESSTSSQTFTIDDISIFKKMGLQYDPHMQDHDYEIPALPSISLFSMNVVVYITGYVVKMCKRRIKCPACVEALEEVSCGVRDDSLMLLNRKNNGGLIRPSRDIIFVCEHVEKQIRLLLIVNDEKVPKEEGFFASFVNVVANEFFQKRTLFGNLTDHMLNTSYIDGNSSNHLKNMIKIIVTNYCKIRFHSFVKKQTEKEAGKLIRKTLSRLIIFSHQ